MSTLHDTDEAGPPLGPTFNVLPPNRGLSSRATSADSYEVARSHQRLQVERNACDGMRGEEATPHKMAREGGYTKMMSFMRNRRAPASAQGSNPSDAHHAMSAPSSARVASSADASARCERITSSSAGDKPPRRGGFLHEEESVSSDEGVLWVHADWSSSSELSDPQEPEDDRPAQQLCDSDEPRKREANFARLAGEEWPTLAFDGFAWSFQPCGNGALHRREAEVAHLSEEESRNDVTRPAPLDRVGGYASIGSTGHKQGRCQPCVFFFKCMGRCRAGKKCDFCHLHRRPTDKKERPKKGSSHMLRPVGSEPGAGDADTDDRLAFISNNTAIVANFHARRRLQDSDRSTQSFEGHERQLTSL